MIKNIPEVSVIMSVFNEEEHLHESIDSILNQTFADFEFIIVDDGSTDRTCDVLSDYEKKDVRIKVFRQENKGLAVSLNNGISRSKGKLIARMDADDMALPERLEKQVAYLKSHPGVDVLGTAALLRNAQGEKLGIMVLPEEHESIIKIMYKASPIIHPSVIMRRETILSVGGYREDLARAQDYELWSRLFNKCRFHNLQTPLLIYSVRERLRLRSVFQAAYVRLLVGWRIGRPVAAAFITLLNVFVGVLSASSLYRSRTVRGKRWSDHIE